MAVTRTTRRMIRGAASSGGLRAVTSVKFPHPKHLAKIKKTVGNEILLYAAFALQKRVRIMLSKPGKGKLYSGNRYRSAKAPNPPTVQSGDLRNSFVAGSKSIGAITHKPYGMAVNFRQANINMSKVYGPKLERTHPFFFKSVQRMRNDRALEKLADRYLRHAATKCNREFPS